LVLLGGAGLVLVNIDASDFVGDMTGALASAKESILQVSILRFLFACNDFCRFVVWSGREGDVFRCGENSTETQADASDNISASSCPENAVFVLASILENDGFFFLGNSFLEAGDFSAVKDFLVGDKRVAGEVVDVLLDPVNSSSLLLRPSRSLILGDGVTRRPPMASVVTIVALWRVLRRSVLVSSSSLSASLWWVSSTVTDATLFAPPVVVDHLLVRTMAVSM
jgi:hypothetical protein